MEFRSEHLNKDFGEQIWYEPEIYARFPALGRGMSTQNQL